MDVVFNGKVLGRKAEGVPTHGEQDVVALHPPLSRNDVKSGIRPGMSLSGRIGELNQGIVFGLCVVVFGVEGLVVVPIFLPLFLNRLKIIAVHAFLPFLLREMKKPPFLVSKKRKL